MERSSRTNILVLLILITLLLVAGVATYYVVFVKTDVANDAPVRKALAPTEGEGFTDMEGNQLTLEDYFGKTLIVTSWASWCPQCATDLPALSDYAGGTGSDVQVLAVNRAENKFTAERFLNSIGDTSNLTIILDSDDHFFEAHEGYAMPETILYDNEGNVVVHQRGNLNLEELKSAVANMSTE